MDETTTTTPRFDTDALPGSPLSSSENQALDSFQGINIGGHTVTAATEHLDEEQKQLVRWLHFHARQQKWTWDDLVRHAGYSTTTWARIFKDKYRYAAGESKAGQRMPIDEHCKAIARLKKLVDERASVKDAGFIETSVWERVEWLCRRAFVRQRIGFIFGESQIGKTTCLQEFQRRNNHGQTTYVEMPPSAGVQFMLRAIAEALLVPSRAGFDQLIKDVCAALDGSKLLILDEIQRVFTTYQKGSVMRCLDTLRYIHDRTHCGLVLCGTNVMHDQLVRGDFAQYLKQLKRRGRTFMLQLPNIPPREDLDALAAAFGLPAVSGQAEEVLLHVAKADGLGACKMLLQDAAERAGKKRRDATWDDFVWAFSVTERMAKLGEE